MIMASVTTRITPTLYALGTLTTLLSFAVIALYIFLLVRAERRTRSTDLLAPVDEAPSSRA
jgi:hypothetical protein